MSVFVPTADFDEPGSAEGVLPAPETAFVPSIPFVAELVGIMSRLIDVLSAETALVQERRIDEIADLQAQKSHLADAYARGHRHLSEDPTPVRALPPAERDRFRELARKLDLAVKENARVLKASATAIERVVNMFVDAVKRQKQTPNAYTKTGAANYGSKAMAARKVSITLNENI